MKKELSAGAILTKKSAKNILILLVEHKDNTYVFPKGHVKNGETPRQAAKREVLEEVGLKNIKIGKKLGIITRRSRLPSGRSVLKDIIMFSAKINNYKHLLETEEEYAWFPIEKATKVLRYKEDIDFLIGLFKNSQNKIA